MGKLPSAPATKLKSSDFKVGSRVRVPDEIAQTYIKSFGDKIKEREGVVMWVSKYDSTEEARKDKFYSSHVNKVQVKFLKRNGRGKEFTEMMFPNDLVILAHPEEPAMPEELKPKATE